MVRFPSCIYSIANRISTLSYQFMTQPLLKAPPKTPLPDPDRDPEWFGEIWLKYPSSSTLVPLRLGLVFKAKMSFSVVLNEAMLQVEKDSTDSYLFRNGATRIIKIAERMDTWYKAMPEPLSPTQIVSPSQLKIQYVEHISLKPYILIVKRA